MFTSSPLCHYAGVLNFVAEYTFLAFVPSLDITSRMEFITVVIIVWIIPSDKGEEVKKLPVFSLPWKYFLRACIVARKPTHVIDISSVIWPRLLTHQLRHFFLEG
jgi:hypothetical protein